MIEFDDVVKDQNEVFTEDGVEDMFDMLTQGSVGILFKQWGQGLVMALALSAIAYTVRFIAGGHARTININ